MGDSRVGRWVPESNQTRSVLSAKRTSGRGLGEPEGSPRACDARLSTGDLPILWQGDGREYNPDFITVEAAGTHWLIESKMEKELSSADVKGKESAALRWASHVSAKTGVTWRYLLVGESDIAAARGSWAALRGLDDS